MTEYLITIKIVSAGNKEIDYSVDLVDSYEDYPEDYFQIQENKEKLADTIQEYFARQISQVQLTKLINNWIQEIKQGRRRITLTIDLPSETLINQNTKTNILPKPKKPNPFLMQNKQSLNISDGLTNNQGLSTVNNLQPKEPVNEVSTISQETSTNQADF